MAFLDDFAALPVWLRGFARLRPATLQPPPTRLEHLQRPEVQVAVAARPGKSTGNPWLLTMGKPRGKPRRFRPKLNQYWDWLGLMMMKFKDRLTWFRCLFIEARNGLIWFQNVSDVLIGSDEPIMHPNTGCSWKSYDIQQYSTLKRAKHFYHLHSSLYKYMPMFISTNW